MPSSLNIVILCFPLPFSRQSSVYVFITLVHLVLSPLQTPQRSNEKPDPMLKSHPTGYENRNRIDGNCILGLFHVLWKSGAHHLEPATTPYRVLKWWRHKTFFKLWDMMPYSYRGSLKMPSSQKLALNCNSQWRYKGSKFKSIPYKPSKICSGSFSLEPTQN